jgi:hypothetical protein
MKKIEKKTWPDLFQKILDGDKTFDLRLNDFDVEEGDVLVFKEWDPETKEYTGRMLEKKVGFVGKWKVEDLTKWWSQKDIEEKGLLVMSLLD